MQSIIQVGCGQVVRERILPAIKVLAEDGLLTIGHVVDVVSREQVAAALDQLLPARPVYHQIGGASGELARLLRRASLETLPLIVATPTPHHAEHVCAALAASCPVALEKPLAGNRTGLEQIATCLALHDSRLLFPLGYYLIEKGLPLLALARRGALTKTQLGCVAGIAPQEWAELRDELGAVSSVTAVLREGPDPRQWVLSNEAGGHTLETFSHLVAMVLPWVDDLKSAVAMLGRTPEAPSGHTENLIFAEFEGPNHESVRLACEKWCPESLHCRWLRVECECGSATMDLEYERLTVRLRDRERIAHVSTRVKYEPQLRMFAARLSRPDEPTEYEIGRQSALISLSVRELGLGSGIRVLPASWLDDHLEKKKS